MSMFETKIKIGVKVVIRRARFLNSHAPVKREHNELRDSELHVVLINENFSSLDSIPTHLKYSGERNNYYERTQIWLPLSTHF